MVYIGVQDGGSRGGGAVDPPQDSGRYDIYSGKRQHICLINCHRTEQASIHLPEINFGWGNNYYYYYNVWWVGV